LVPMFVLVAYGFGIYRKKRADEREEITEADHEQHDSEVESTAYDNDTAETLHDIDFV
jgi:hypothetical protein